MWPRRKALSKALAKARLYNQGVVECMNSGLLVLDENGRILNLNKRAQEIMGIDKAQGLIYHEVLKERRFREIVEAALFHSSSIRDEEVRFGKRILLLSATPIKGESDLKIGVMAIFQDITEIKRLEEALRLKERLAAVGEFATRVAHEFRNPIGSISSSAKLLGKELKGNEYLEIIMDECKSIEGLTDEFLSFAKPSRPKKTRVPLKVLLEDVVRSIISNDKDSGIVIKQELYNGSLEVEVDVAKIKRAIMNIVQNGIEAMQGGGELFVKSEIVGEFVKISVEDNGPGIKDEDLPRIFDPFFTTKEKGTGLGLAIAKNIIASHNGRIECESEVGGGAKFSIYLPYEGL